MPNPEQMPSFDAAMRGLVGVCPDELPGGSARGQAKAVVCEIIRLTGGRICGKTRVYKIFYLAHLFYAKRHPDSLTDWPIVRMPHGPGINDGDELIEELQDDGVIEVRGVEIGPYPATEFRSLQAGIPPGLTLEGIEAIRDAVRFAKGKSAAELSELTHEHSHTWRNAKDGEELDIYLDLLTADEYEERKASMAATAKALRDVW